MKPNTSAYDRLKRIVDFTGATMGLLVLAPFFIVVALVIRMDSAGPILFRQDRAGKNGMPFRIFKFRTMYFVPRPAHGFQKKDDPRITRVGHWLRRFSLDELPQLINVARGEMSFIGPRPALVYQINRYDEEQWHRLDVHPGITGWAQVNGRNRLSWQEKIDYDLWYVVNRSVGLDMRILWKTIGVILGQSGLYYRGQGSAWNASSASTTDKHMDYE